MVTPVRTASSQEGLTLKEMEFADQILSGASQGVAYRAVYGGEKTKEMTARRASSQGRLVRNRPGVVQYLNEKRAELEEKQLWTRVDSVKTLAKIARSRERFMEDMKKLKEEEKKRAALQQDAADRGQELNLPEPEINSMEIDPPASYPEIINAVKELNRMYGWDRVTIDHVSSDRSMTPPTQVQYEIIEPGELDQEED